MPCSIAAATDTASAAILQCHSCCGNGHTLQGAPRPYVKLLLLLLLMLLVLLQPRVLQLAPLNMAAPQSAGLPVHACCCWLTLWCSSRKPHATNEVHGLVHAPHFLLKTHCHPRAVLPILLLHFLYKLILSLLWLLLGSLLCPF